MVVQILVLWGNSVLFSSVIAPTYIPINNVWGFPFLHILSNIFYLQIFWWQLFFPVLGDTLLLFWLELRLLIIYMPSLGNLSSGLLPIFWQGCLIFLILSCMSCLYILDINSLSAMVISFANILFYLVGCLFILLMASFAMRKPLSLTRSFLFIFAFISLALGD